MQWSDKTKGKEELIEKIYSEKRRLLKVEPEIDLSDLLSARDDIAIIEKTSNSNVRKHTQSSINKVIIGQVKKMLYLWLMAVFQYEISINNN